MTTEEYELRERAREKFRNLLATLRKASPPHRGLETVVGGVSPNGNAMVQLIVRQGLSEARTIEMWFNVFTERYEDVVDRLRKEYEALHGTLFLMTYAPDLYNDDVAPHDFRRHKSTDELTMM